MSSKRKTDTPQEISKRQRTETAPAEWPLAIFCFCFEEGGEYQRVLVKQTGLRQFETKARYASRVFGLLSQFLLDFLGEESTLNGHSNYSATPGRVINAPQVGEFRCLAVVDDVWLESIEWNKTFDCGTAGVRVMAFRRKETIDREQIAEYLSKYRSLQVVDGRFDSPKHNGVRVVYYQSSAILNLSEIDFSRSDGVLPKIKLMVSQCKHCMRQLSPFSEPIGIIGKADDSEDVNRISAYLDQ